MITPGPNRGIRLFLGAFPPAETSAGFDKVLAGFRVPTPGLSWVEPDRWHATLAFLGDTLPERVPALSEALREFAGGREPFGTGLRGVGAFPTVVEPKLIFAGVEDADGSWSSLAGSLRLLLAQDGFPTEDRPYRPHLTLARVKDAWAGKSALARLDQGVGSFRADWTAGSFRLVRSRTGNDPRYETLEEFKFGKV